MSHYTRNDTNGYMDADDLSQLIFSKLQWHSLCEMAVKTLGGIQVEDMQWCPCLVYSERVVTRTRGFEKISRSPFNECKAVEASWALVKCPLTVKKVLRSSYHYMFSTPHKMVCSWQRKSDQKVFKE